MKEADLTLLPSSDFEFWPFEQRIRVKDTQKVDGFKTDLYWHTEPSLYANLLS